MTTPIYPQVAWLLTLAGACGSAVARLGGLTHDAASAASTPEERGWVRLRGSDRGGGGGGDGGGGGGGGGCGCGDCYCGDGYGGGAGWSGGHGYGDGNGGGGGYGCGYGGGTWHIMHAGRVWTRDDAIALLIEAVGEEHTP